MTLQLNNVKKSLKKKFATKKLVFGTGFDEAKIVFVSEAPTREEIEESKPLAGESERLLNKLLKAAGINKNKAYFTNIVKYPADINKALTSKEIKASVPFLKEELKTIKPEIVVTLGPMALNGVGLRLPLDNAHGKVFNMGTYELIPTFHPRHAEKDPWVNSLIQADFIKIKEHLKNKINKKDDIDEV